MLRNYVLKKLFSNLLKKLLYFLFLMIKKNHTINFITKIFLRNIVKFVTVDICFIIAFTIIMEYSKAK